MVPYAVRQRVWSTYRAGQEVDKNPSPEWHEAAKAAIGSVAIREQRGISLNEEKALKKLHPAALERV
jgi:hypothetical protein